DEKRLQYAAMVAAVDESVGRIRNAIKHRGIENETIIIFTSDQGSWFENPPFRGSKRVDTLCEGGARVPLLVHWPGVTSEGSKTKSIVQTTDLFPTFVEMGGGVPRSDLDGVSLVSTIKTNEDLARGRPVFGYRAYEDLYGSVRDGRWKLLVYRSGRLDLFDVESDRYETNECGQENPDIVDQLVSKLSSWEEEVGVEDYSGLPSKP
ncbi:MAG: sulfatase-like hydrolase/transferase, partial [Planctomycetota bacterium]